MKHNDQKHNKTTQQNITTRKQKQNNTKANKITRK